MGQSANRNDDLDAFLKLNDNFSGVEVTPPLFQPGGSDATDQGITLMRQGLNILSGGSGKSGGMALGFGSGSVGTREVALTGSYAGIAELMAGTQTYDRSGLFAGALNYSAAEKATGLQLANVGEKTLADSLALLKDNPDVARQLIDQGFNKIDQGSEGARKGTAMLEALGALRPSNYVELASADWNSAWVLGKTLGAKGNMAPGFTSDPTIFGAFVGSLALTGDPSQTASQLRSLMQLQDDTGLSYFHSAQALEPASGVVGAVLGASLAAGAAVVQSIPGIAASVGRGINAIGNVASDLVGSALKRYTAAGRPMTNLNEEILSQRSSRAWATLSDGTNQGVKHFADYWTKYPDRIPSLETRLGLEGGTFARSVDGFNAFTYQAQRIVDTGQTRVLSDSKAAYFLSGNQNANKGVVVIVQDGKLQSMMPSNPHSFGKLR